MRAKRYAYCDDTHSTMTTVEVLTSVERRRRWSREEKLGIVAESALKGWRAPRSPRLKYLCERCFGTLWA
jgi:hypothetical protein